MWLSLGQGGVGGNEVCKVAQGQISGDSEAVVRDLESYSHWTESQGEGFEERRGAVCLEALNLSLILFSGTQVCAQGRLWAPALPAARSVRPVSWGPAPALRGRLSLTAHLSLLGPRAPLTPSLAFTRLTQKCQQLAPHGVALDRRVTENDGQMLLPLPPWTASSDLDS